MDELFELCKEVYEKFPEWKGTFSHYQWVAAHSGYEIDNGNWASILHPPTPAYTSDYLTNKLSYWTLQSKHGGIKASHQNMDGKEYSVYSDTALKALLKLTLALKEAGEL